MSGLHDRDIERLLGGTAPGGWENLSALVERVRREASVPVDLAKAREHVAAAAAAVREAPTPSSVPTPLTRTTWRKRTVFAGLFSTIVGKILVGAVALAAVAAGAGAAGAFPDPVDRFFGVDNEPAQQQIQEQEQLGEEQQVVEPNLFEYQQNFEFSNQFGNQGEDQVQNQFSNQFSHQNSYQHQNQAGTPDEEALLFQYRHAYQGGDDSTDTTVPQMLQQMHQQGVEQGANTTVPQNQQQAQQQGLDEETNTTQQQQQQQQQDQQQTSPGDVAGTTAGTTGSGAANGGPGGTGNP